jgi:hypothetical protein
MRLLISGDWACAMAHIPNNAHSVMRVMDFMGTPLLLFFATLEHGVCLFGIRRFGISARAHRTENNQDII